MSEPGGAHAKDPVHKDPAKDPKRDPKKDPAKDPRRAPDRSGTGKDPVTPPGNPKDPHTTPVTPPPPPPPPPPAHGAGPAAPGAPKDMAEAHQHFTDRAGKDDQAYVLTRGPDGKLAKVPREVVQKFRDHADDPAGTWDTALATYKDIQLKAATDRSQAATWKTALDALPDLHDVLADWQEQRELNPLDKDRLRDLAAAIQTRVDEFNAGVDALPAMNGKSDLLALSQAACRELAAQSADLIDPIGAVTSGLTTFAASKGGHPAVGPKSPKEMFHAALEKQKPDAFWSKVKTTVLDVVKKNDPATAKAIDASFDQGFGAQLKTLGKAVDGSAASGGKFLGAATEVAATIATYDTRLVTLQTAATDSLTISSIQTLRTALRELASRVVRDTAFYQKTGVLVPPAR